jgi:hypothetical protein
MNGDGTLEIFSLSEYPHVTPYSEEPPYRGVLELDGSGTYQRSENFLPDLEFSDFLTSDMRIDDLNKDGFDDLVIAVSPDFLIDGPNNGAPADISPSFKVGLSNGSLDPQNFTWESYGSHEMDNETWADYQSINSNSSEFSAGVSNIETIDLDQDGDLDILVGYYVVSGGAWETSTFSAFLNNNGSFQDATSEIFPQQDTNSSIDNPTTFIFGFHQIDMNLDGFLDLVLETKSTDKWLKTEVSHNFFISDGTQLLPYKYDSQWFHDEISSIMSLRSADLNGDGFEDLVGRQSNLDGDIIISAMNSGLIA